MFTRRKTNTTPTKKIFEVFLKKIEEKRPNSSYLAKLLKMNVFSASNTKSMPMKIVLT